MASTDTGFTLDLEAAIARVAAGDRLSIEELTRLADTPDILGLGMLADVVRRRINGTRVSYVRVADVDGRNVTASLPDAAREVRLSAVPDALDDAVDAVAAVKQLAGARRVTGLSWVDVERWASGAGDGAGDGDSAGSGDARAIDTVLRRLRAAGLDALSEVPLDLPGPLAPRLAALAEAGFEGTRLTVVKAAPVTERLEQVLQAAPLLQQFPGIVAVAPLPMTLNPLRPTTGYDDVKLVALVRVALPEVPHVQVDWLRYGPKLAQVALTFGADDVDNVSASDDGPEGRRRAPVEELKKNIESAGFAAVERDGRFVFLS
jgi:aminodeoxyfutalosine synthase